jgi:hypothetical protein
MFRDVVPVAELTGKDAAAMEIAISYAPYVLSGFNIHPLEYLMVLTHESQ